jgi:hypothetical protein
VQINTEGGSYSSQSEFIIETEDSLRQDRLADDKANLGFTFARLFSLSAPQIDWPDHAEEYRLRLYELAHNIAVTTTDPEIICQPDADTGGVCFIASE